MPEHHQASDFEMSAKRRQKGKATESPGPSQEFTDEIEEDDRQEAGEETTSPTLGDLAKGHSELAGQVSALASQLELLVNAMASSTVAQTPAAQIKSAVVPPDPEDDEDFEDDSSESTDFELDGTSAAAHSADNPFPRQMRDAAGELVDLRNELTYQAGASLRTHTSAINRVHLDLGYDPPARGHIISSIKQGINRTHSSSSAHSGSSTHSISMIPAQRSARRIIC